MNIVTKQNHSLKKKPYKPDLDELLSQCERNYRLLCGQIPELISTINESKADQVVIYHLKDKCHSVQMIFEIVDRAPYTTTMKVRISSPKVHLQQQLDLLIRLYHDLRMVEVMEGSGPAPLKPVYPSMAGNQKQIDEKKQLNRFVGECLQAVGSC